MRRPILIGRSLFTAVSYRCAVAAIKLHRLVPSVFESTTTLKAAANGQTSYRYLSYSGAQQCMQRWQCRYRVSDDRRSRAFLSWRRYRRKPRAGENGTATMETIPARGPAWLRYLVLSRRTMLVSELDILLFRRH